MSLILVFFQNYQMTSALMYEVFLVIVLSYFLVTFAHVFYWIFKEGGLAEVKCKQIIHEDNLPVLS